MKNELVRKIEENPQFKKSERLSEIGYLLISFIPMFCFIVVWIFECYMGYAIDRKIICLLIFGMFLIGCYLLYKGKKLLEDLRPLMSDYERAVYFDEW